MARRCVTSLPNAGAGCGCSGTPTNTKVPSRLSSRVNASSQPAGFRTQRICQPDVADQDQLTLILRSIPLSSLEIARGHGDDAKAAARESLVGSHRITPSRIRQRGDLASDREVRTLLERRLGCALHDEAGAIFAVRHRHARAPAFEVERHPRQIRRALTIEARPKQRRVERIGRRCPTIAVAGVQLRQLYGLACIAPEWIDGDRDFEHARGERAGLVGAQDVDAAEILQHRQPLHDGAILREARRAPSQRHGRDHR